VLAEVDGATSADVGRVCGYLDGGGTASGNYAAYDKAITRGTSGSTAVDGDATYAISAFQGSANQSKYPGWDFTTGTGDWKFISGYDYPVLNWQTEAPPVTILDNLGGGFVWP
jgi:hypothetical protein